MPFDPTFQSTQFQLQLSNMQVCGPAAPGALTTSTLTPTSPMSSPLQPLLEINASVKPQQGVVWVTTKQPTSLEYKIKNITEPPPQETQFGTTPPSDDTTPTKQPTVEYEVCTNKKVWSLQDKSRGEMEIPGPQEDCYLRLTIVPKQSGPLPVPLLLLKYPAGGNGCVLTSAQVHNVNHKQTVTVHPTAGQGEQN